MGLFGHIFHKIGHGISKIGHKIGHGLSKVAKKITHPIANVGRAVYRKVLKPVAKTTYKVGKAGVNEVKHQLKHIHSVEDSIVKGTQGIAGILSSPVVLYAGLGLGAYLLVK